MATIMLERSADHVTHVSPAALLRLSAWLSPGFPVGAFSYSHGLERVIEDGEIKSAGDLAGWLGDILHHGSGRNDAILLAHAWRAAASDRIADLRDIVELAAAFQPSKERHLEATAQGRAFLSAVVATWPTERLDSCASAFGPDDPIAYPVAVAIAAAAHDVPVAATCAAYLQAFVANLVSAAVRAVPLGQTDGQRVVAGLVAEVEAVTATALAASLEDIGGAAFRADIASMKHETQYTRLFRS